MSFTEWEAAQAAHLDLWKWEIGEYPKWFKVRVIAWYNLHRMVAMHSEDAMISAVKQSSKSKA